MTNRDLIGIVNRAAPHIGKGLQGVLDVQARINAVSSLCVELGRMDPAEQARLLAVQPDGSSRKIVEVCFEQAVVSGQFNVQSVALHDELSLTLVQRAEENRRRFKL